MNKQKRVHCLPFALTAAAIGLLLSGAGTSDAQTTKTNRFGARDPRTVDDTKAPKSGPITAPLAQKYLNAQMEDISGNRLYLVENVKVEVGGGVPYTPNLGAFQEIDVKVPLYPIRGSYLQYQCSDPKTDYVGPPNTNCRCYTHRKAKGYCYKTTFGDWRCFMADPTAATNNENIRERVAPPLTAN